MMGITRRLNLALRNLMIQQNVLMWDTQYEETNIDLTAMEANNRNERKKK